MVTRTSSHGQFYGCRAFPRCKGTRRLGDTGAAVAPPKPAQTHQQAAGRQSGGFISGAAHSRKVPDVTGSTEQQAIWDVIAAGGGHAVVQARAGTGKSFTIFHAACRVDEALRVGVLAFNRIIAAEMAGRFNAAGVGNCSAVTFHSLGYGAIRRAYGGGVAIDQWKMRNVAEALLPVGVVEADKLDEARGALVKLCSLCRNYLASPGDITLLEELADRHNVEMGEQAGLVLGKVAEAVEAGLHLSKQTIDFDDMLYVPAVRGLQPEQFDLLMVDEAQDTNSVQMSLALKAIRGGGRMVVVGDRFQTIYGFRGSHSNAMEEMARQLGGVVDYPLTVTRRNGKRIVRLAQCLVPDITALPDAPNGVVRECVKWDGAVGEMAAGDMVLCRVNRYLVPVAYALLRRGVKAVIRGRDIGANVTALIGKVLKTAEGGYKGSKAAQDGAGVGDLLRGLTAYREREETRLLALGKNGAGRLESLSDQCDTLAELCEGCGTVADVKAKVAQLFADFDPSGKPNNAVVCSTIHGAKGLEAERVYVLNTELLPHPRAARAWEVEQEHNLIYVAVTRAKGELVFVAGKAGQWKGGDGSVPGCLREGMAAVRAELAARAAAGAEKGLTTPTAIDHNGEEPDSEAEDERWLARREAEADGLPF